MQIKLYNTLSKQIENFNALDDKDVKIYSCGPTVYNYAHIGNMRAFLFADFLQRVIRTVGGFQVKWVMNITNIDDKTIRDSRIGSQVWLPEMGNQSEDILQNLLTLTEFYEKSFIQDIAALGVNSNHFYKMPRATDYINQMQKLILKIINKRTAYISQGSIYFDLSEYRKTETYGKLFNIDFGNFIEGSRIDSDQYERENISDFVLWKSKREDEPYWDFEIDGQNYPGRPGWHIECSAMEFDILGLPFDIHTGGVDLRFPHHEDEIAQSKAGYGIEPTVFWCHNEFLEVEGEKMSKSKGNFFTLRDLIDQGFDPLDIRFSILSTHYGSIYNFTNSGIKASAKARARVQEFIYSIFDTADNSEVQPDIQKLKNDVFGALADDLHSPKALAKLFGFINEYSGKAIDELSKDSLKEFFTELNEVFNVWEISPRVEIEIKIPSKIIDIAEKRLIVRANKDFAESDNLRKILDDLGYIIKDSKDSYTIIKK
ncbi:MAG: cysteine--tRNA ligase [Candidatus Kapabacteria bacterium]|nr:cysteine--tRNA ligase [Candidatus Kapabacteria bacterium]